MAELTQKEDYTHRWIIAAQMLFALILFMTSIDLLTVSLLNMNNEVANEIFLATNNPFIGLFIGLLMTALIQSSSTVTAMVVAVVASGNLSITQAVPIVMGANIGTTITSTLVSFTYIMKKSEFRKAISAGVLHDLFNIITVIILLPMEYYFSFMSKIATFFSKALFSMANGVEGDYSYNIIFTRSISNIIIDWIQIPILALVISVILLFLSIKILSTSVYKTFVSNSFKDVSKHIFKFPYRSFAYGIFFTAAVQSSTVTTSLLVPAVATKKISLNKVFPFIIGANIGTTITAAIAAIYKTEAAIAIAIVHFLFNFIGALIFLPFPGLRNIPVKLAIYFGKNAAKQKVIGIAYILLTFFVIPFILIYLNKDDDTSNLDTEKQKTEIQATAPPKSSFEIHN
ncbi:Na/Pi cotransporter family protein [Echinicola strongylocentroti]|uniref:Na/Pi cotransporter family protein n=1 Tax=Echinicola strongylocentroti TaxID=1795355 RepID=A0A2Z4IKQ8_9BACT|nr:Na/Pi symporter [Echinicola strongylocentroti]AWW31128.1 Na/Pi cotransporter family protein [Echinicola strongylocentroti]